MDPYAMKHKTFGECLASKERCFTTGECKKKILNSAGRPSKNHHHTKKFCDQCKNDFKTCMKLAKRYVFQSDAQCAHKKLMCKRSCKYGVLKCMAHCEDYYHRCMISVHAPNPKFHGFQY